MEQNNPPFTIKQLLRLQTILIVLLALAAGYFLTDNQTTQKKLNYYDNVLEEIAAEIGDDELDIIMKQVYQEEQGQRSNW